MKNKEKTIYGVISRLVDPNKPGVDMKMREIKRLKGLIGATPVINASGGFSLWYFKTMKNADDAIAKLISLKLDPEKAVHRFKFDGKKIVDYLGTEYETADISFNTAPDKTTGGKKDD